MCPESGHIQRDPHARVLHLRFALPGGEGRSSDAAEASMDETWVGMAVGTLVLVIAAVGVAAHYRRERRRAEVLRRFDLHE